MSDFEIPIEIVDECALANHAYWSLVSWDKTSEETKMMYRGSTIRVLETFLKAAQDV